MTQVRPENKLDEALVANAKLQSHPVLRELVDQASRATDGVVSFAYATQPAVTTYYVFHGHPDGYRLNARQAVEWLSAVVAAPHSDELVYRTGG